MMIVDPYPLLDQLIAHQHYHFDRLLTLLPSLTDLLIQFLIGQYPSVTAQLLHQSTLEFLDYLSLQAMIGSYNGDHMIPTLQVLVYQWSSSSSLHHHPPHHVPIVTNNSNICNHLMIN